jgi:hypothetical protein
VPATERNSARRNQPDPTPEDADPRSSEGLAETSNESITLFSIFYLLSLLSGVWWDISGPNFTFQLANKLQQVAQRSRA